MIKKFRVWDSVGKKWMDVFEVNLLEHDYLNNPEYPVQQWTGLIDSHGVEIYEGDILKSKTEIGFGNCFELISAVRWESENGSWFVPTVIMGIYQPSLVTIIGNIFQNPELLEKC